MERRRPFVVSDHPHSVTLNAPDDDRVKQTQVLVDTSKHRTVSDFELIEHPHADPVHQRPANRTQVWVGKAPQQTQQAVAGKGEGRGESSQAEGAELLGTRLGFFTSVSDVGVECSVAPPATRGIERSVTPPATPDPKPILTESTRSTRRAPRWPLLLAVGSGVALLGVGVGLVLLPGTRESDPPARPRPASRPRPAARPRPQQAAAKLATTPRPEAPTTAQMAPAKERSPSERREQPSKVTKPPPRPTATARGRSVMKTNRIERSPRTRRRRAIAVGNRKVDRPRGRRKPRRGVRVRYDRKRNVVDVYLPVGDSAPKVRIVRNRAGAGSRK